MKRFLDNAGLMQKIVATIVLLAAVALGVMAVSTYHILHIDARYHEVGHEQRATFKMARINRLATELPLSGYQVLTHGTAGDYGTNARQRLEENHGEILETLQDAVASDPTLKDSAARFTQHAEAIYRYSLEAMQLAQAGQAVQTQLALSRADAALHVFTAELVQLNNHRTSRADAVAKELSDFTREVMTWSLVIGTLASLLAAAVGFYIAKFGIVGPLLAVEERLRRVAGGDNRVEVPCTDRKDEVGRMCRAVQVLRDATLERDRLTKDKERLDAEQKVVVETLNKSLDQLAGGDLTANIAVDFTGDYAALKANFNGAVDKLRELIGSVAVSAEQIRTGSAEIAQASEDLARRTESNAASLEETAAAVSQMDGRLKATAHAANDTVTRADQTKTTVASGRSVADEAVQAMGRVSESAKGIDSVIEGLDKIAFQTRVLAMNAAVEAGRAGEAGRGFAVVADLVSALAMRAEEEAKRARDQLTVTQSDVVTAVQAVEKVDGALQNISGDVEQVHALLATIASDNQAQASAVTEINSAIASMDQATQQNAAMVEETSAASRNLLSEVGTLSDAASRFHTGQDRPAATRSRLPKLGKEGGYASPVRPLPADAIAALTRSATDDWREF